MKVIGIKTLERTKELMQEATQFYTKIENKLTTKNLILDLRNNGGGSITQIELLIESIKQNKTIENIYVLVNFKTGSGSELTTYKLSKDSRTIISGENTRGQLIYGWGNGSISGTLNCKNIAYDFSRNTTNIDFLQ